MVFYKKRRYVRRRRPVKRTKTGAKIKSTYALTKQVNKLARKVNQGFQKIYYRRSIELFPAANYVWSQINFLPGLTPVFGTFQSDETSNKAYLKSMRLDINLRPNTEPQTVDYTFYIVSMKNNSLSSTYDRQLNTLTLTPDEDFIQNGTLTTQAQVFLNPKIFNIHMCRRIRTEAFPGNQPLVQTRNHRMTFKKYFKNEVYSNPEGNWFNSEIANSKRYFALCFNNNISLDLENPALDINCLLEFNVPT